MRLGRWIKTQFLKLSSNFHGNSGKGCVRLSISTQWYNITCVVFGTIFDTVVLECEKSLIVHTPFSIKSLVLVIPSELNEIRCYFAISDGKNCIILYVQLSLL